MPTTLQRITPFLWFDANAEEAVNFYVSIFKNSRIGTVTRYDEEGARAAGRPKGSVMTVPFELDGQQFTALNGGPHFQFSGAISFVVNCETQEEVDHFWAKLSAGGQQIQCGWLTDRFGVSWQVVPTVLVEMLQDKDPEKSKRVMAAMLKMKKIEIAPLKRAYEGRASSVEFQKLTLDALRVGEEFVSDDHLVTPEDIEAHGFAAEDDHPWLAEEVAPPTLMANQALHLRHSKYIVHAGLHARMEFNFLEPIRLGMRVRTRGKVIDKYERRGKPYMVTEYVTEDETGRALVRGQFTQMIIPEPEASHGHAR